MCRANAPRASGRAERTMGSRARPAMDSRQVEDEDLGGVAPDDLDPAGLVERRRVARAERLAVHLNGAFRHLNPGVTTGRDLERGLLASREEPGIQIRVLVDRHRPVPAVAGSDEA